MKDPLADTAQGLGLHAQVAGDLVMGYPVEEGGAGFHEVNIPLFRG